MKHGGHEDSSKRGRSPPADKRDKRIGTVCMHGSVGAVRKQVRRQEKVLGTTRLTSIARGLWGGEEEGDGYTVKKLPLGSLQGLVKPG